MEKKVKAKNKKQDFKSNIDPYGGYTGNCLFGGTPVQDADDL